jgi:hypothetical protein
MRRGFLFVIYLSFRAVLWNSSLEAKSHAEIVDDTHCRGFEDRPHSGQHPRSHGKTLGVSLAMFVGMWLAGFQMEGGETVYIYGDAWDPGNG